MAMVKARRWSGVVEFGSADKTILVGSRRVGCDVGLDLVFGLRGIENRLVPPVSL